MFDAMEYNSWDEAEEKAMAAFELYELGEMPSALRHLQEAIEINPENSAWHFNAGLTLDAMSRFEEAIDAYKEALQYNPHDPEIMNSLAVDYTRMGQYDLALDTFEMIEQIDPSFEPAYCNRIITYTEIDRHDMAEEMFYMAQQLNPDCPICFYNIGNSLFSRREYKRAIWCWERTALLEPTHPQIHYRIAQAYWADGNSHQARNHFLEELRNNPGDLDVVQDFGMFLLEQGEIESAREKFNRILEIDPNSGTACHYLGEIALSQGDIEEARKLLRKATRLQCSTPGPRYRLAQIALEAGDKDKAKSYLQTEAQLNVESPDVLLSMGRLLMELGDYDYSTDCFLRVVDQDPTHAQAFYCLGCALAKREDLDGALQFLEHVMSLDAGFFEARAHAAHLYFQNEQLALAWRTVREALQLLPDHKETRRLARRIAIHRFWYQVKYRLTCFPLYRLKMFGARVLGRIMRPLRIHRN